MPVAPQSPPSTALLLAYLATCQGPGAQSGSLQTAAGDLTEPVVETDKSGQWDPQLYLGLFAVI